MTAAVFVCADQPVIPHAGTDVVAIKDLCSNPKSLVDGLADTTRAVLLLHHRSYDLAEVQKALRTADLDPLGVPILDMPNGTSEVALAVSIAGLTQRAETFAASRPEHVKPVLRGEMTRRGLFRPPGPVYLAVPMIDQQICAAADGCRACVDICPQDAYKWHQGRVHFNKDACEPCGRCVSGCPTEAISNPTATPAMLVAQIKAIVGAAEEAIGIRFVCSRSSGLVATPGWFNVSVPCTGMVPGSWLVTTLFLGAGSVSTASCATGGCPLALDRYSLEATDFARAVLAGAGLDPETVPIDPATSEVHEPAAVGQLVHPFTRAGDVEMMLALASESRGSLAVDHPASSVGVVAIEPDTCTLCAQCAQTCQTNAISATYAGTTVSLTFDAATCTNCRQCTIACPEFERGAITVVGRVDAELLRSGRQSIHTGTVLVCDICGEPIAPTSMMDRIGELLGDDFGETMSYLSRNCISCRGLS